MRADRLDAMLAAVNVKEVWGIGGSYLERLNAIGVQTALDLKRLDPVRARELLTVVGQRTVQELNGIACSDLDLHPKPKQATAVTRSFGKPVVVKRPSSPPGVPMTLRNSESLGAASGVACMPPW